MKTLKPLVDNLKLRYAYGTSGRDLGGYYLNESYYSNTSSYDGVSKSGSIISQLANNNIKWETTYNHALGVDFGLFNRVNATVDLYHRRSAGLAQKTTLPATEGSYSQYKNVGEVVNKGLEASVNVDIIKNKDFSWNLGGNISFNKNKITKISSDMRTFYLSVGQSIGDIKAIRYKGVDSQTGAPLFLLGDGTLAKGLTSKQASDTANMVTIGNTNPKFYGGFQSIWKYRRFSLVTDWTYAVGQLVSNYTVYTSIMPSDESNSYKIPSSWHIWSGVGDAKANMPDIYSYNSWLFYSTRNSVFYQKGDYLRLKNIRLSYTFDKTLVAKAGFTAATLYGNVDNVLVFKRRSNWKDEESTDNPLRIVLGVNIDF
jgi:TonB-dependent starch-binding outer membrane protein SusC